MAELTLLDVRDLHEELSRLAQRAPALQAAAVLARTRALLEELRLASAGEPPSGEGDGATGWQATRQRDGAAGEEVVAWNEALDTLARGVWAQGTLAHVQLQVGKQFWDARAGATGETWLTSADDAGSPAEEAHERTLQERAQQAWRAALAEATTAGDGWRCAACGWRNETGETVCRLCLAPTAGPAQAGRPGAPQPLWSSAETPDDALPPGGGGASIELPDDPDLQQLLRQALTARLVGAVAGRAGEPKARRCPKCGCEAAERARYCGDCGAELPPAGQARTT